MVGWIFELNTIAPSVWWIDNKSKYSSPLWWELNKQNACIIPHLMDMGFIVTTLCKNILSICIKCIDVWNYLEHVSVQYLIDIRSD